MMSRLVLMVMVMVIVVNNWADLRLKSDGFGLMKTAFTNIGLKGRRERLIVNLRFLPLMCLSCR